MITELKFENFRVLRDATLPLGRLTVIIGPNGSGKSTALAGIRLLASNRSVLAESWQTIQAPGEEVKITVKAQNPEETLEYDFKSLNRGLSTPPPIDQHLRNKLLASRVYALDPAEIAKPCPLEKSFQLQENGSNLAAVLTTLQDQMPERFDALNNDLKRWMPEFDRILLDTIGTNARSFLLRTSLGRNAISAALLSQGTLVAVALLTLSHLPDPPPLIGLEEIDRGIHPRLLRDVQDALHRLAFPENFGDDRTPVQVIVTTHSPYFLDLFSDTPEDIVISEKENGVATFHALMEMPNSEEILRGAHLGDVWFAGVLGGVPVGT